MLIPVPRGDIGKFIKAKGIISPQAIYQQFVNKNMRGVLCVQFLAAFNIFRR